MAQGAIDVHGTEGIVEYAFSANSTLTLPLSFSAVFFAVNTVIAGPSLVALFLSVFFGVWFLTV